MVLSAPVTLIAGPTASGKSALALDWATADGAVIINADSQQLYADLRVLTARPSPEDEARADHRLYGLADSADAWSVGRWVRAVSILLEDLKAQGRRALIVGGTGLYFTALTKGIADIPEVSAEAREAAQQAYDSLGEAAFRAHLAERDPRAVQAIAAGDRQRLVRAWAVAHATGRSLSEWQAQTRPLLAPGTYGRLVIEPPRAELYERCDRRVGWMVDNGALDEVAALMRRSLDPDLPAMKAVGVREFAAHLQGRSSLTEAMDAVRQATRNYAKRQLTWFRNQTGDWPRHRG